MLTLALIGCGAIGRTLLTYLDTVSTGINVVAVLDRNVEATQQFLSNLRRLRPKVVTNLDELLEDNPDIVVEAASPEAVKQYIPQVIGRTKHVVIMSVSAFIDVDFLSQVVEACRRSRTSLHIPSGAIGGVDLIKAHALHGLRKIVLTTRKPPHALGLDVNEEKIVYEGNVIDAVRKYPRNVNVYATVLIASNLQIDKIYCRVIADPKVTVNVHEIEVESELGKAYIKVENVPSEINPRTSKIAAFSLIRKIIELADPSLDIGT